jgi:IclR family acetate operon transcriptional repressor
MPDTTEKRSRGRPRSVQPAQDGASVQSLDRAVSLLRLVADQNGLSLTEVSQTAGLAPSTAYRMLTTLQHHGIVEFEESSQLWYVGVETFRMGSAFLRRRKLADRGRSVIQDLMVTCGETANLALAESDGVIFVNQVETHEAIRAFFRPGTRSPYHASGIGKAILAFLGDERRDAMVKALPLERFTPRTRTDIAGLLVDLAETRARFYAFDDEERNAGMRCIAAPVFNEFGDPIGGVSISGPTVRLTDSRVAAIAPRVTTAGKLITTAMGGLWPAS